MCFGSILRIKFNQNFSCGQDLRSFESLLIIVKKILDTSSTLVVIR